MTRTHLLLALVAFLFPLRADAQIRDEIGELRLRQQYVEAMDRAVRDLAEQSRAAEVDTTQLLRCFRRVSQLAFESGDHFAARLSAEAATALVSVWDRPVSAERGAAWLWLGLLDRREFGPELAHERLLRARAELEKSPEAHRIWGHLLQAEANVLRTAEGSARAVPLYRRAAEYRRAHLPRPDLDTADNLVWLAWNLNEAGAFDEAMAVAGEAAEELRALGAEEHSLQKSILEMEFDRALLHDDFEACRRLAEREVEIHERNRPSYPLGYPRGIACSPISYTRLLWVQLQTGEFERAFRTWDKTRGTVARDFAALRAWLEGAGRDRESELSAKFSRVRSALRDFDAASVADAKVRAAVTSLVAWLDVQTWLRRWEGEFPQVEVNFERVANLLEPGQAMVGFQGFNFGGKESSKFTVRKRERWGVVVRPDREAMWVRVWSGSDERLQEVMREDLHLQRVLLRAARWPTRVGFDPEFKERLHGQTQRLIGGVLPYLEGIDTVLSVGTDSDYRFTHDEGQSRNVVTLSSPGAFVQLAEYRNRREPRSHRLVMGSTGPGGADALPHVSDELATLRDLLPRATTLARGEATEERWEQLYESGALGDLSLLHLACHVQLGPTAQRDALVLDDATGPGLGTLEAGELLLYYGVDPDLVVLSGCSTGQGRLRINLEHYSLTHALLASGALTVVASRWDVDDEASALFMRRFYENLTGQYEGSRDGHASSPMPASAAVGEASRWLRSYRDESGERPFAHPIYWGGFGAYGLP